MHYTQVNVTNFKMTDVLPTAAPMLYIRVDDGDYYYDVNAQRNTNAVTGSAAPFSSQFIAGGSFVKAVNVDVKGVASINTGDHMQNIQLGDALHHDLNDFEAAQISVSVGNDTDTQNYDVDAVGRLKGIIPIGNGVETEAHEGPVGKSNRVYAGHWSGCGGDLQVGLIVRNHVGP